MWVGERDGPGGIDEVGQAALAAPPTTGDPNTIDLLLDGVARRLAEGFPEAAEALSRALEVALAEGPPALDRGHWVWQSIPSSAVIVAQELWDANAWHGLASRQAQFARDTGALVQLQFSANVLAWSHVLGGQLDAAACLTGEDQTLAAMTGNPVVGLSEVLITAFRGDEGQAFRLISATARRAVARGLTRVSVFAEYARGVLNNALGRHADAIEALGEAFEQDHVGFGPFVVPELAEAACRTGDTVLLAATLKWMSERTRLAPTEWSLGIEARIRALLSDGSDADALYQQAIDHLRCTRIRPELARTHLLYGEWLRRHQRRVDARKQLGIAHQMFLMMGMSAFAKRAKRELEATGATARKRVPETRDELTAQERQIAKLARAGLSNPEIGARLFLSPRTVEWHLRKVFGKLGIASRRELDGMLPAELCYS
jgi:DNA-binding CsgD family transcriptional regulator